MLLKHLISVLLSEDTSDFLYKRCQNTYPFLVPGNKHIPRKVIHRAFLGDDTLFWWICSPNCRGICSKRKADSSIQCRCNPSSSSESVEHVFSLLLHTLPSVFYTFQFLASSLAPRNVTGLWRYSDELRHSVESKRMSAAVTDASWQKPK